MPLPNVTPNFHITSIYRWLLKEIEPEILFLTLHTYLKNTRSVKTV